MALGCRTSRMILSTTGVELPYGTTCLSAAQDLAPVGTATALEARRMFSRRTFVNFRETVGFGRRDVWWQHGLSILGGLERETKRGLEDLPRVKLRQRARCMMRALRRGLVKGDCIR